MKIKHVASERIKWVSESKTQKALQGSRRFLPFKAL